MCWFLSVSVYLFICLCVCLTFCLSDSFSVWQPVSVSVLPLSIGVCLSVSLWFCLPVCLSICLSEYLAARLFRRSVKLCVQTICLRASHRRVRSASKTKGRCVHFKPQKFVAQRIQNENVSGKKMDLFVFGNVCTCSLFYSLR